MKKLILSALLFGAVSLGVMAQDDVYFTPSKSVKKSMSSYEVINDSPAPLSGSNRDVDEYNRRGKSSSYFKKIGTDSLGNDIIEFHTSAEDITDTLAVYPGTKVEFELDDDYKYSRRLSRFDDYYLFSPWLYGYYGFGPYWRFRYSGFYLYDPWYDPWYYSYYGGWYDPWYYGYGWYDPWYYGYYGWGYPYGRWGYAYYGTTWYVPGGIRHYSGNGVTGTSNHGTVGRPGTTIAKGGNYGGYRGNGQTTRAYDATQNRNNNRGTATSSGRFGNNRTYSNTNTNTNNNRTYTPTTTNNSTYSNSSSRSSGGGGGFSGGGGGATRSSGSSGGGGGGGRFGGRR